jgi:hypothetical protein
LYVMIPEPIMILTVQVRTSMFQTTKEHMMSPPAKICLDVTDSVQVHGSGRLERFRQPGKYEVSSALSLRILMEYRIIQVGFGGPIELFRLESVSEMYFGICGDLGEELFRLHN